MAYLYCVSSLLEALRSASVNRTTRSPSTPSTTNSSSPQPFKKRSTTKKQQSPSTTPTPQHQALPRQHLTKQQKTTSPLSPTGRLWDPPPLRGWSRRSALPQKTNPPNPHPTIPPPPVGKAGFEVWVFTKGGLVCTSNMQIGSYCRVSPPDSTAVHAHLVGRYAQT